jgi:hypothetical protein
MSQFGVGRFYEFFKKMLDRFRIACYISLVKKQKRPLNTNQLGNAISGSAIAECSKNPHAVELGRRGGLKGGTARAKALTARQRSKIARLAANARWKKK